MNPRTRAPHLSRRDFLVYTGAILPVLPAPASRRESQPPHGRKGPSAARSPSATSATSTTTTRSPMRSISSRITAG